jgi:hypothetical protein
MRPPNELDETARDGKAEAGASPDRVHPAAVTIEERRHDVGRHAFAVVGDRHDDLPRCFLGRDADGGTSIAVGVARQS